jgi:CheY-like chemotaxis protein
VQEGLGVDSSRCSGCDAIGPLRLLANGKRYCARCHEEVVDLGWVSPVEERKPNLLARVVLPREEVDHLLQEVLAAGMLLRHEAQRPIQTSSHDTLMAAEALDVVVGEIQGLLSDVLPDAQERVLIVDDEPEMLLATKRAIERSGISVMTAGNGLAALEALRNTPIAAVVLDLVMPGLSGWDVLKEIRAVTDLPVVVVTAHLLAEADRLRVFAAGADDFVAKPYSPAELSARVRAVLRREMRAGGAARPRTSSFEGRRIVLAEQTGSASIKNVIRCRPLFHPFDVAIAPTLSDVVDGLKGARCDLIVLNEPDPADFEVLSRQLQISIAPPVLLVGPHNLLADLRGPVPDNLTFLTTPCRAQELWAAVEESMALSDRARPPEMR